MFLYETWLGKSSKLIQAVLTALFQWSVPLSSLVMSPRITDNLSLSFPYTHSESVIALYFTLLLAWWAHRLVLGPNIQTAITPCVKTMLWDWSNCQTTMMICTQPDKDSRWVHYSFYIYIKTINLGGVSNVRVVY